MLEVIERKPRRESDKAPLLFVHGAWHGAWCWDENFLDFFAEKGYRAVALSLRGHGNSSGAGVHAVVFDSGLRRRRRFGCQQPARTPGRGGPFPGRFRGAEVSGVARHSGRRAARLRTPERNPRILAAQAQAAPVAHRERRWPGQGRCAASAVHPNWPAKPSSRPRLRRPIWRATPRLLDEEYALKIAIDMLWLNLPRPHLVTAPLLVLGAEDDVCFTATGSPVNSRGIRPEAEIFPKMSHDMMLDPGWRAVAERIHAWLEICVPAS